MTYSEAPLVLETPGGLSVSYRGRLLYSARDPSRIPKRLAADCDRGPSRLFLVPSPLLWYGLPELLASMSEGSAVLCAEADPALAALARERMPQELDSDGRLAFIECPAGQGAIEAASALGRFRACSLLPLSGGESLNASLYRAMADRLSAHFEAEWRNSAALMVLGPRWAKNIFDNMAFLPSMAPEPLPRFPGPTVVCGAGPSLEVALPFIARQASRGALAVVACDTALGSLLASGVAPDLVVCLEGQAHNLHDFTCLGSRPVSLVADLSSHPATFRAARGPKHLSLVRITRSPLLDRAETALARAALPFLPAPPLGSVGVHAAQIALSLASGPIFAAGLDFSFLAGKTHARGCPSLLAEERRLDRLTRWPSQFTASFRDRTIRLPGEGARLSDPVLLSYAKLFEGLVEGRLEGDSPSRKERVAMFDIRGGGPSIGCRRVSVSEAEALVVAHRPVEDLERARASEIPSSPEALAGAARAFLVGELELLDRLRFALRGGGAEEPASRTELEALVSEADYLSWGFPDRSRGGELAQDYLNRLVPQLEYWSQRLEGLIARAYS